MFLFSKSRKEMGRCRTLDQLNDDDDKLMDCDIFIDTHNKFSTSGKRSPQERRSKTFSRGFLSLRKIETVDPTLFKTDIESKVDLTKIDDIKRLYPQYNSNDSDHNPLIRGKEGEAVTGSARGRRRILSASKIPSLRKRSRSMQRTPSPKRSFFRDATSSLLDSSAKTLRGWATYLHKQPLPNPTPKTDKEPCLNPTRSSPIPIPSAAPTLAPIEISNTPFQISENVPLTARPSITPILGPVLATSSSSPKKLCLNGVQPKTGQKDETKRFSGPSMTLEKQIQPENPFDDCVAGSLSDADDNTGSGSRHWPGQVLSPLIASSVLSARKTSTVDVLDNLSSTQGKRAGDSNLALRRTTAIRRLSSPMRARTTEEAIELFENEAQACDTDTDSPTSSLSNDGSDTDWASKPTHEDIRTRFKKPSSAKESCEAKFSEKNESPVTLHPRPLVIRTKTGQRGTEDSAVDIPDLTEVRDDAENNPSSPEFSNGSTSSARRFRFANTQRRSASPETVRLPQIITLDHEVNEMSNKPSSISGRNRFSVLAELRQSDSTYESAPETLPTATCKCSPCQCNPCRCGDAAPPERLPRHLLRSQLSAISDLSEEEKHCAGIV